MRRISLLLLIVVAVAGFWSAAWSQFYYLYPITGKVLDPDGVGTDSLRVVFYENDPAFGYADDLVGLTGWLGEPGRYAINASEDFRLNLVPGRTYHVAAVQEENGYGADPVSFVFSGQGYELVPDLRLVQNGGIEPPPEQPPPGQLPSIHDITFGNRKYQPVLVAKGQEFIVSSQPRISARAVSAIGLNASSIAMVVNQGTAQAKTYNVSSYITQTVGAADAPTSVAFTIDFYDLGEALPEGEQAITFRAANMFGATDEVVTVTVAGGEPRLIGIPLAYPNPVHLAKTGQQLIFQYTLSRDLNVTLNVFDISSRIVWKRSFQTRAEGGSAGVNKVTWNLITDQGSIVSSGIYVFTLVNRENGKLLGKGKLTALP